MRSKPSKGGADRERHQRMSERLPRATPTGPSGHGVSTRRTQDWRGCTAVCDTAAVGTIVWNPWKPSAQMYSSALPPASQIRSPGRRLRRGTPRRSGVELSKLKSYQQRMPFAATRSSIRAVRRRLCI
jgi:hypothetical protein